MNLVGKISQALHGARKLEVFLMVALIAVAALLLMSGDEGGNTSESSLEAQLQDVLGCIEGAGSVRVAVNEDGEGNAIGVLVVAEGASRLETYLSIQQAVRTFTGIDVSQIEIIEMEGGK